MDGHVLSGIGVSMVVVMVSCASVVPADEPGMKISGLIYDYMK